MQPDEKLVLFHIPKTGGTSLHDLLAPHFADHEICPERFDVAASYTQEELAKFRYISGHFGIPTLRSIPGPKRVVTILRDPVERLLSLYDFWRLHTWDEIEQKNLNGPRLAKSNSLTGFLQIRHSEMSYAAIWVTG